jgi:hypothetical protein
MNEFHSWTQNQRANAPFNKLSGNFTNGLKLADAKTPASIQSFLASP